MRSIIQRASLSDSRLDLKGRVVLAVSKQIVCVLSDFVAYLGPIKFCAITCDVVAD